MEEQVEKVVSQEEITKQDLEHKAEIVGRTKDELLEAKDEIPTGITIHYKDRTITYFFYAGRSEVKKKHTPTVNQIIDLLVPLMEEEAGAHKANAEKIVLSNT